MGVGPRRECSLKATYRSNSLFEFGHDPRKKRYDESME